MCGLTSVSSEPNKDDDEFPVLWGKTVQAQRNYLVKNALPKYILLTQYYVIFLNNIHTDVYRMIITIIGGSEREHYNVCLYLYTTQMWRNICNIIYSIENISSL